MSGDKLLLDTNIVLYLLSGDETIAEFINKKEIYVSFITELELLGYDEIDEDAQRKLKNFLRQCTVINVNERIKKATIKLRKSYKLKLPDCIIAATSEYLKIPLITADKDFKKIENINTVLYQY